MALRRGCQSRTRTFWRTTSDVEAACSGLREEVVSQDTCVKSASRLWAVVVLSATEGNRARGDEKTPQLAWDTVELLGHLFCPPPTGFSVF